MMETKQIVAALETGNLEDTKTVEAMAQAARLIVAQQARIEQLLKHCEYLKTVIELKDTHVMAMREVNIGEEPEFDQHESNPAIWTAYLARKANEILSVGTEINDSPDDLTALRAHEEKLLAPYQWQQINYKSMFEQAVQTLAAIDDALGIGDDGCGDPEQTLTAIAELKELQKMEAQQLRKIHPLDFPIEVFLADLTTRPANIIRAELAGFASYAGTGTFDIEPPFTVRHLCMFSRSEMRKWPHFGRKCLNEVEEMLRARGLQLWESHDERSLRLLREHKEYFKR